MNFYTPRTDQECGDYDRSGCWKSYIEGECVQSDFSRQLERELSAANDRIKRLEEAGDKMAFNHNPFTFIEWRKAKEAKP
jgi:hypothetical protein